MFFLRLTEVKNCGIFLVCGRSAKTFLSLVTSGTPMIGTPFNGTGRQGTSEWKGVFGNVARRPIRGREFGGRPRRLLSDTGDFDGSKTIAFGFILAFGSGEEHPESELKAGLDPRESKKNNYFLKFLRNYKKGSLNQGDYLPRSI